MHTYNCIFCSFFVQLQELLQCQVGRIFLKGKKTTACGVFFVFLSEKSKKKIKKTQNNKTTKPNHNRSSQQGTRRRFSLPSTSASTSPAHLHAGEELPSETLPRCRLGANRGGGPGTHTPHPPPYSQRVVVRLPALQLLEAEEALRHVGAVFDGTVHETGRRHLWADGWREGPLAPTAPRQAPLPWAPFPTPGSPAQACRRSRRWRASCGRWRRGWGRGRAAIPRAAPPPPPPLRPP